jgi:class 3 adenylate cyclase/tetratricopeptide (TPR) repeat protein
VTLPLPGGQEQKRWATILFADMQGFSDISEKLGAERTYQLLQETVHFVWNEIERHGGRPIEYAGDSILAVFGAPVAIENASLKACLAGLAIVEGLRQQGDRLRAQYGAQPQFRIGISGGSVVVGNLGLDQKLDTHFLGAPVNLAARLESAANPGEILCSAAIADQVFAHIETDFRADMHLKGFDHPQSVYRVVRRIDEGTPLDRRILRGTRTLVGRDRELGIVLKWLRAPPAEAGLLALSGSAGIGKTRLLYEALQRSGGRPRPLRVECNDDLRDKPLEPFRKLLGKLAQGGDSDPPGQLSRHLEEQMGTHPDRIAVLVKFALSNEDGPRSDPRSPDPEVWAALQFWLEQTARNPDFALIVEDIHWLDPASGLMLRTVQGRDGADTRILTTLRLGHADPWGDIGHIRRVTLDPLSRAEAGQFVRRLLQVDPGAIPAEFVNFVLEQTEGNALFIEEIIRHLQSSGQISQTGGRLEFSPLRHDASTHGNIQHLLLSRFDTMNPMARRILTHASIIGRTFTAELLAHCCHRNDDVDAALAAAWEAGIIEHASDGQRTHWQFSHALIGAAIRGSLLADQRRTCHREVATALEALNARRVSEVSEELANHHEEAGQYARAILYLGQSAAKAHALYAVEQSNRHLEHAFALADQHPGAMSDETYCDLLVLWAQSMEFYGDFTALSDTMKARIPRLQTIADMPALVTCLSFHALALCHCGHYQESLQRIAEAERQSERMNDVQTSCWHKVAKARIYTDSGGFDRDTLLRINNEALEEARQAGDQHVEILAIYGMAAACRKSGLLGQSIKHCLAIKALGESTGQRRALAVAGWALTITYLHAEEFALVAESAELGLSNATPGTSAQLVSQVSAMVADIVTGRKHHDPEEFEAIARTCEARGDQSLRCSTSYQYSSTLFGAGRIRDGWRALKATEAMMREWGLEEQREFIVMVRASVLLAVSGLPMDEKTHDNARKPGLADILTVLSLRFRGLAKAERLLNDYLQMIPERDGARVARAYFGLGLIAGKRGNHTRAREYLLQARGLYREAGHRVKTRQLDRLLS